MAQLFLKALSKLCDIPGSSIFVPVFAPILPMPMNIIGFVTIFLIVYYAPTNSFINGTDNEKPRNSGKAALYSFIIYYVIALIIWFFGFKKACEAAAALPF